MTLAPKVLNAFGLKGPAALIAQRENLVYRVGDWALRAHRPGYRSLSQIEAELAFMDTLHRAGCTVPEAGEIREVDGQVFSTVRWLDGQTFADKGQVPLEAYAALGRLLKQVQSVQVPNLDRPVWDIEAMLGARPLWGRWQDHPYLSPEHLTLFQAIKAPTPLPPLQLIHADALRENVMLVGDQPYLIDFDDCAYSYPSFDVATVLVKEWQNPDFEAIETALLSGYGPIDPQELALMKALRALTYVGWVKDRMDEPGMAERSAKTCLRAIHFATAYREMP